MRALTIVIKISLKRKEFYIQNSSIETFEMKFLLFNTPNTTVLFVLWKLFRNTDLSSSSEQKFCPAICTRSQSNVRDMVWHTCVGRVKRIMALNS